MPIITGMKFIGFSSSFKVGKYGPKVDKILMTIIGRKKLEKYKYYIPILLWVICFGVVFV